MWIQLAAAAFLLGQFIYHRLTEESALAGTTPDPTSLLTITTGTVTECQASTSSSTR